MYFVFMFGEHFCMFPSLFLEQVTRSYRGSEYWGVAGSLCERDLMITEGVSRSTYTQSVHNYELLLHSES